MFYRITSMCKPCSEEHCIKGMDSKGCTETSLRKSGTLSSLQPVCYCFYSDPLKHGVDIVFPNEVIQVMKR